MKALAETEKRGMCFPRWSCIMYDIIKRTITSYFTLCGTSTSSTVTVIHNDSLLVIALGRVDLRFAILS